MRPISALLVSLVVIGCARTDTGAGGGAGATTLVPSPGVFGKQYSRDGRLAFSKFVEGKAAIYVASGDGSGAKRVSFGVWDVGPLWSPDGKSIALTRDAGGHNDVLIVPADSGAERVVAATSVNEFANAWLADGSGLLFGRNGARGTETWVYHVGDGTSEKLFDVDGGTDSYPSPDGKSVAYELVKGGKSTIWLWDIASRTHRQLTTEGFETIDFGCFSPDSRTILFESRRTGTLDLWRLEPASGAQQQLTKDVAEDFNGRWSPDGTRIVFASNRGGQPDLWVLSTGEGDVQRLTDSAIPESNPDWTPDGQGVIAEVALGHTHLYSLPVAGGAPVQLTSGDWDTGDVEVSQDGAWVAYSGTKNGDLDIWTIPVAGGEPVLVSGAPGDDDFPSWSPDGKQIAFASRRSGNPDIWIAPAGGGTATRLTDWPTGEFRPRWSPDGNAIAFLSDRDSPGQDIWIMPAAGGAGKRLTTIGLVGPQFRWSPDGKTMLIPGQIEASGGQVVFTVPVMGGTPKVVAPATSFSPRWAPNGREFEVSKCSAGYCVAEIWSVDGKHVRSLNAKSDVYEFTASWSADGSQLLIGWQDLVGDGGNRVDIRSAADGKAQLLAGPPGNNNLGLVGFADGDKVAIAGGGPNGNSLQRITVPAVAKSP